MGDDEDSAWSPECIRVGTHYSFADVAAHLRATIGSPIANLALPFSRLTSEGRGAPPAGMAYRRRASVRRRSPDQMADGGAPAARCPSPGGIGRVRERFRGKSVGSTAPPRALRPKTP
jgi:hypothetical protein